MLGAWIVCKPLHLNCVIKHNSNEMVWPISFEHRIEYYNLIFMVFLVCDHYNSENKQSLLFRLISAVFLADSKSIMLSYDRRDYWVWIYTELLTLGLFHEVINILVIQKPMTWLPMYTSIDTFALSRTRIRYIRLQSVSAFDLVILWALDVLPEIRDIIWNIWISIHEYNYVNFH